MNSIKRKKISWIIWNDKAQTEEPYWSRIFYWMPFR